ncbi:MAG TPA: sulfotransferase [Phycisphaerales bacterium]|nr:sulfotransferase [Phycisphaerales bacterium]
MQPQVDPRIQQTFAMLQQGRLPDASRLVAQLLREQPENPQARFASALIDRQTGRLPQAVAALESLHAQLPQNPAIRAELAATHVLAGHFDKAVPVLRELVAKQPNQPFGHYWLGQAHLRNFEGTEAARCFERVRQLQPTDSNVLQPLARAYLSCGRAPAAEAVLRDLLTVQPHHIEGLDTLGAALEHENRLPEAGEVFRRVLGLAPDNGSALAGLARVLQSEGKKPEARALLGRALGAERVPAVVISTYASLCSTPEERRACIAAARASIADARTTAQDRAGLHFAVARLLDAEGDPDGAFEAYRAANDLYPKLYDPAQKRLYTDHIIQTFSAPAIKSMPRAMTDSRRPIFILGMPRSGTTLVEQILGAHPDVHPAGELQEMRRIWRELVGRLGRGVVTGLSRLTQADVDTAAQRYLDHLASLDAHAPRATDKMPHNFEQLGLINLLFPNARVVHCMRNPVDTCVSCYTVQLSMAHPYSTDLAHLGHAYAEYHRLMRHWRAALDIPMLDVVYEDVVADIDTLARRIVDFAGLPWDDACLRFYEARRAVTTASYDQVRKPIYTSSVGRWRRHERQLQPLIAALRDGGVPIDEPAPDPA